MELFAYASDFTSANRNAPEFPPALRDQLKAGSAYAGRAVGNEERRGLQVAIRTPWPTEEDAYVLATRRGRLPQFWSVPSFLAALAIYLGVLGAVWFAAGPLVSRARRLERQVLHAAADGYSNPVKLTGSDELTRLGAAFNKAGAELHGAIKVAERRETTLRRFVENTAHDVGTPLTVLQGHLTNLQSGADADALMGAVEETHYIAALLGNLVTAAQLEDMDAPLERHRVDLNELIERVVARHRPLARERGIELEFATPEEPVHVAADVTLLERALGNPVHNAVQHGGDGGHVTVHLEVPDIGHGSFRLRVLDDGPGVPPDQLEQLSERSWRGDDARQRLPDGSGLGLAIAREIADRHGFKFGLAANEPTGLTVTFEGPVTNGSV
jgi:signal transduction histidine kinase